MRINIKISRIDYVSMLPYIMDKLYEINNPILRMLLSMGNITDDIAAKIVGMVPDSAKEQIIIGLVEQKKDDIVGIINDLAQKNNVPARVSTVSAAAYAGVYVFGAQVDDIDYEKIAEQLLPFAFKKLEGYSGDNILLKTISRMEYIPDGIVQMIMPALPKEAKDDLAVYFIDKNKDKISKLMNDVLEKKGIRMTVEGITVSAL